MRAARAVAVAILLLVIGIASPLAVSGFWADRALSDSEGYADDMAQAWHSPQLQVEVTGLVTEAATERIYQYFGVTGPGQNRLADYAVKYGNDSIARALASGAFAQAWRAWHLQLHQDLAAIVRGEEPQQTSVSGQELTVDITPLVRAVLTGPVGQLAANIIGDRQFTQTIDTGYDLQAQLESFGTLWQARWWAAAAALVGLVLVSWLWRPPLRGLAAALLAAGLGCVVGALWQSAGGQQSPATDTPYLSAAVSDALTGSWGTWLWAAAVLLLAVGGGLLAWQLLLRRPAPVAPVQPSAETPESV